MVTRGDTVTMGGARVATPLALVTAVPSVIGPTAVLAVNTTGWPGIPALVTAFLSVALIARMTHVPLVRRRTCVAATVIVVLTAVELMLTVPEEPAKHEAPL